MGMGCMGVKAVRERSSGGWFLGSYLWMVGRYWSPYLEACAKTQRLEDWGEGDEFCVMSSLSLMVHGVFGADIQLTEGNKDLGIWGEGLGWWEIFGNHPLTEVKTKQWMLSTHLVDCKWEEKVIGDETWEAPVLNGQRCTQEVGEPSGVLRGESGDQHQARNQKKTKFWIDLAMVRFSVMLARGKMLVYVIRNYLAAKSTVRTRAKLSSMNDKY